MVLFFFYFYYFFYLFFLKKCFPYIAFYCNFANKINDKKKLNSYIKIIRNEQDKNWHKWFWQNWSFGF